MDKKKITFDDTKIEKYKFHKHKSPISLDNIDINKIVVANQDSFGEKVLKYLIGYKDINKIKPLCIFLPKMHAYR